MSKTAEDTEFSSLWTSQTENECCLHSPGKDKQNPIYGLLAQQQSHSNPVLNNWKENKIGKISYSRSLGGKIKPELKTQYRTKGSRLAKVMTSSRLCILMGINKVLHDRFDCSYGDSVQGAQLMKRKRK